MGLAIPDDVVVDQVGPVRRLQEDSPVGRRPDANDHVLGDPRVGVAVVGPQPRRPDRAADHVAPHQRVLEVMQLHAARFPKFLDVMPAGVLDIVVFNQPANQPQSLHRADAAVEEGVAADDNADAGQLGRIGRHLVGEKRLAPAVVQAQPVHLADHVVLDDPVVALLRRDCAQLRHGIAVGHALDNEPVHSDEAQPGLLRGKGKAGGGDLEGGRARFLVAEWPHVDSPPARLDPIRAQRVGQALVFGNLLQTPAILKHQPSGEGVGRLVPALLDRRTVRHQVRGGVGHGKWVVTLEVRARQVDHPGLGDRRLSYEG